MMENATFIIKSGFDGLLLNKSGEIVEETTYYSRIYPKSMDCINIEVDGLARDVGDTFIAFDGAWWVYYHWLLSCLGPAGIANRVLPDSVSIAVPDWAACGPRRPSVIARRVFNQVERVVEPERLMSLPDGVFHARRAYFLFVDGDQPSDAALHPLYRQVFSGLRSQANHPPQSRIFISRGGRDQPHRLSASDEKIFDKVIVEYNFKKILLEDLNFQSQIDQFSDASVIVAPHGSGLANLVFASPGAKVIELQTEFETPGILLPWFYLLAAACGFDYAFLNREAGDFQENRLREGLKALGVSRPTFSRSAKAWRLVQRSLDLAVAKIRKVRLRRFKALWMWMFGAG